MPGLRNRRSFRDAQDVSIKVRCSYLTQSTGLTGQRLRQAFEIPIDPSFIKLVHTELHY